MMAAQEISLEKLAYLTNIPLRFLIALQKGELNKLPGPPYVRGYLLKIAEALNADAEPLLKSYKNSIQSNNNNKGIDRLPENRFAIKPFNKSIVIVFILLAVLVLFLISRLGAILGVPTITVSLPASTLITNNELLKIEGKITPGGRLTLNNELIYADSEGKFEKEIILSQGLNTLEFDAKKFLGREAKFTRQVFYQPE